MFDSPTTRHFRVSLDFITTFVICAIVFAIEGALVVRGVLPLPWR